MAANGISTLSTKEARQKAKLNISQAKRQGKVVATDGTISGSVDTTKNYYRPLNEYDITELPTQYVGNTVFDNLNEAGLNQGRPWVGFLPSDLFAGGEQGAYFDASDKTSLFQDAAGTIPVTAVGQPVGKILDKSGRNNHATQSTAAYRPTWQIDPYGYGCLLFDGIDDFMVTGNINLTTTSNVTASVGLLVDPTKATAGVAICTGGDPSSVNGTFLIGAPSSSADHSFYLRGTSTIQARVPNEVLGDDVLTGVFDISQTTKELELIPRLSGVVSSNISWSGTNAGTGNFANLPLYIGALGGSGTYFKGHIYNVIIRGALSTSTQITNTEAWINRKLD